VTPEKLALEHGSFLEEAAEWRREKECENLRDRYHVPDRIVTDGVSFWRSDSGKFMPCLQVAALALLAAPATSASSERFFSNAAVVDRVQLDSARLEKMAVVRAFATSPMFTREKGMELLASAASIVASGGRDGDGA